MHDFRGKQNPYCCHWSDEMLKNQDVFLPENHAPVVLGHLAAIQAHYMTLQTLRWLLEVL